MFALGGALALQNSIKVWSSNHRTHHQYTDDNDKDPYSAGRGLWFSHVGWMLRDYPASQTEFENVRDLEKDWVVAWQHDNYWLLAFTMNVIVTLGIGALAGDLLAGLLLVGFSRLVLSHHTTFFINSLAHFWGKQTYSDKTSSRDNPILALLTYGEGYHNYHHTFQWDYRNGIRWWQWDPTKWLISACSQLGLAKNLVRVPDFKIQRAILDTQFQRARDQLELSHSPDSLRATFEREYQLFTESINQWTGLQTERYESKKAEIGGALREKKQKLQLRWESAALRTKFKELEYSLKMQRKRLNLLMEQMQLQAQPA